MKHKRLHCWDCGVRVIETNGEGLYKPSACLQQVKFRLSDGSYMVNPFCLDCSAKPWTPERLNEFRSAILEIMPAFEKFNISGCDGPVTLTNAITGVFT